MKPAPGRLGIWPWAKNVRACEAAETEQVNLIYHQLGHLFPQNQRRLMMNWSRMLK